MRLRESQRTAGGATDVAAIEKPLVADGAKTIGIGQAVACCKRLALGRCTGDADTARGQVIDVGHRERECAAHRHVHLVGCDNLQMKRSRIAVTWSPGKGAGISFELKPAWQSRPVYAGGCVAKGLRSIRIGKRTQGNDE